MNNIMWFRSDLRINDNPALYAALDSGPTVAVYCITEDTWADHYLSPAKRSLILRQVCSLANELRTIGVPLLVENCGSFTNVTQHLTKLARRHHVDCVYFNHEYELNERRCTKHLVEGLQKLNIATKGFHDQCAIPPGKIKTGNGDWYKVFTAFKRNYLSHFTELARPVLPRPKKQKPLAIVSDLSELNALLVDDHWQTLWPSGENVAHKRLNSFSKTDLNSYHEWRDFPAAEATSTLSPYLAVGALSSRQCIETAWLLGGGQSDDDAHKGASTWVNELIWRDFYRHLLFAFPDLCKHKPFKTNTDQLPWKHNSDLFTRWCNASTGYPLVDAAMLQLKQTSWMHNRLRMVTAMFLTKHLFVDWRLGERYFMENLVDGDFASNNGGWQWSASTGVDAAPYFRIFNPVRQSERFDSKGLFIRQYLPQLAALDNKSIHMPSASQANAVGYPRPIVDHASAVAQTKAWFKAL